MVNEYRLLMAQNSHVQIKGSDVTVTFSYIVINNMKLDMYVFEVGKKALK